MLVGDDALEEVDEGLDLQEHPQRRLVELGVVDNEIRGEIEYIILEVGELDEVDDEPDDVDVIIRVVLMLEMDELEYVYLCFE